MFAFRRRSLEVEGDTSKGDEEGWVWMTNSLLWVYVDLDLIALQLRISSNRISTESTVPRYLPHALSEATSRHTMEHQPSVAYRTRDKGGDIPSLSITSCPTNLFSYSWGSDPGFRGSDISG